ncbi:MAG: DNA recombination protein RmuC, partial [Loktanella sp.]|nr:DNA recombination protein RmuC [Loktanella sp.]
EQILSPEQYQANVKTKPGSTNFVEFAVKLPGADDGMVWLPIDAKFPGDAYVQLLDAQESGDAERVKAAGAVLEQRVRSFAKDIHDKYIDPPNTTDFAIMFLPTEGLYAEVVRRGMIETLQTTYHVNIAGPTTMAALLNSLQMGFRTLAIQKRSGEVWKVLGAVKTEFDKFGTVVQAAQQRLDQANKELDKLVGTRTRQIQRKLASVTSLTDSEAVAVLEDNTALLPEMSDTQ